MGWGISDTANEWDALISYTEFGAYEFIKGGIRKPITVIPMGLLMVSFIPRIRCSAERSWA
jgi:hypothetical protein